STMAAIVNHINQTQYKHVVTLENPIEFLHRDINSSVTQREIGVDTDDFRAGLHAALRQDPDVVMIGEMEDAETIDTALKAAETGHLVISSLHTPDAVSTITRVVSMFPTEEQEIARMRLCEALQAVVSQRLLPRADGHGRVPAVEVLISTAVARDLMKDPARMQELHDYITEAREQYGMQTFDQHLIELVMDEVVTYDGVVVAGSTGESALLDPDEQRRMIAWVRDILPDQRWLVAGTGAESTRQAVALSRAAGAEGADAVLVRPPSYYAAAVSPASLVD